MVQLPKPLPQLFKLVDKPDTLPNSEVAKARPIYIDGLESGGGGGEAPDLTEYVKYTGEGADGHGVADIGADAGVMVWREKPGDPSVSAGFGAAASQTATTASVSAGNDDGYVALELISADSEGTMIGLVAKGPSGSVSFAAFEEYAELHHTGPSGSDKSATYTGKGTQIVTFEVLQAVPGYDGGKTQTLQHVNGEFTWVDTE